MRRAVVYDGFAVAFCEEANVALERLRIAISDAQRAGFLIRGRSVAYENAVALYNEESSVTTRTYVAWGDACTNLASELRRAADRLNAEIVASGESLSSMYRPDYAPSPSGWDALPGIAKVAVVLGSLGLVVWGLNSVATVASVFRPARRGIRGMYGPTLDNRRKDRVQKRRIY